MGVDNTWAEASSPMSVHPPPPEDSLLFSPYSTRHPTSPTSPALSESASQQFASDWETKQSVPPYPETPPPSTDIGHYGEQPASSTDIDSFYPSTTPQYMHDDIQGKSLVSSNLDSFYSGQYSQDDVKDSSCAPGVCGLRNLGNTCFMSAGIQCLSNTPTLLHFFLLGSQENIPVDSLTAQFSQLLQRLWSGQMKVIQPADFKHALGSTYPQFKDYRQHDCQEFLALLLDSLHEQLNAANRSSGFKMGVKSQSMCSASISSPPCTPPKVLREKNELAVKNNSVSSTSNLNYYLKESKTSNVNVAVEDDEPNNSIKFDSDKYHRNDLSNRHKDAHPKHNLVSTYDFDHKTVSTKRLKETNLLQDRSAGGGTSGDGLDFKRIKLTDQNNCCKAKGCVQDSNVSGSVVLGNVETQKHPNNAVLCSMNGINKFIKEMVCDENNDVQSRKDESCNVRHEPTVSKEDVQADEHWQKHLALNQSVVVDSFLGQFKSTVTCSQCKHISVTHEPFMYLSVPLPHAMERQIKVTYVPALEPIAVEYLVTVNKQDSVRQLGDAVIALRSSESLHLSPGATVVLAEGFPSRISKTLDDCLPLRHVNDQNRRIYAIETLPSPLGCSSETANLEVPSNEELDFSSFSTRWMNHETNRDSWTSSPENFFPRKKPLAEACAVNPDIEMDCQPDSSTNDDNLCPDWVHPTDGKPCTATSEDVSSFSLESTTPMMGNWEAHTTPSQAEHSADLLSAKESAGKGQAELESAHLQKRLNGVCDEKEAQAARPVFHGPALPPPEDGTPGDGPSEDGRLEEWNDIQPRSNAKDRAGANGVSPDRSDECKQCAICLDDATKDMRRHVGCNIILCDVCIEKANKHLAQNQNPNSPVKDELECPGCRKVVMYDREFIRMDKLGDLKPAVRELTVPVVFRLDTEGDGNNNQKTYKLFGYPKVLRLPSTLTAKELDSAVGRIVHTDQLYTLLTVDGKGDRCSRCLYNNHCRGCRIATDGEVILRSGDTIAVRFTDQVDSQVREHASLKLERLPDNKSLTLYDCLKAFSESEFLDEHNPWFCPTCEKNQCATKTLSVCRYPDLLIVYLKRFVFHNGTSTKLDNKVKYPLNNLKFNPQSSHHEKEIVYDLYACVCHVGGVSAGHYTAYAKNPINSEWYYFNDENVIRQKPQEDDYSNAYILFYKKQGASFPEINLPEPMKMNQTIDEFEPADIEPSVRSNMMNDDDIVDEATLESTDYTQESPVGTS